MLYLLVLVLVACNSGTEADDHKPNWQRFKSKYNKQYTQSEELIRRSIWQANLQMIQERNQQADRGEISYWLGENQFADMTPDEIQRKMHGFDMAQMEVPSTNREFKITPLKDLPAEVDWRKKGAVTEVGNQGECGSCYAFTANGALETQHFLKTGKLVALSAQNLMDCSQKEGNHGCNGGLMTYSFNYVKKNGGIDSELSYPYLGRQGHTCNFTKKGVGATDTGFVSLPKGNEQIMRVAVAYVGPVAIGMDALPDFSFYKNGIYGPSACRNDTLNHSVTVVGYGTTEGGQEYWIAKNSFGTSWGMEGYVNLARNKNNLCGVATLASYPTV